MTRVRLADVASATGLSISTVSRVLSGRGDFSAATRARVQAAAESLGYAAPPGPARRAPQHIDLVMRDFDGRWAMEVAAEMRAAAADHGLDLMLTQERDDATDDWPDRIVRRGSRGVVLAVARPTSDQVARMRAAQIRLVLLEPRSDDGIDIPVVRATDEGGAGAAAEHLAGQGAERFVVVVPELAYRFGRARVRGFSERLRAVRRGLEPRVVRVGDEVRGARAALGRALEEMRGHRIGVFATTDELAMRVYQAAADAGLQIPADVLVVGFDDVPGSAWMTPPLTTVHQPIREMAVRAVELVLRPDSPADVELRTSLVVRGSTT